MPDIAEIVAQLRATRDPRRRPFIAPPLTALDAKIDRIERARDDADRTPGEIAAYTPAERAHERTIYGD